jgi:hypothetical protein
MVDRKMPRRELRVVKTLQLPLHFQLVLGRRDVSRVDARRGFAVRHRKYPGFKFAVPRVQHTRRAFVRYLLNRLKKYLRTILPRAADWFARRFLPMTERPVLFPTLLQVKCAFRLFLLLSSVVWWAVWGAISPHLEAELLHPAGLSFDSFRVRSTPHVAPRVPRRLGPGPVFVRCAECHQQASWFARQDFSVEDGDFDWE